MRSANESRIMKTRYLLIWIMGLSSVSALEPPKPREETAQVWAANAARGSYMGAWFSSAFDISKQRPDLAREFFQELAKQEGIESMVTAMFGLAAFGRMEDAKLFEELGMKAREHVPENHKYKKLLKPIGLLFTANVLNEQAAAAQKELIALVRSDVDLYCFTKLTREKWGGDLLLEIARDKARSGKERYAALEKLLEIQHPDAFKVILEDGAFFAKEVRNRGSLLSILLAHAPCRDKFNNLFNDIQDDRFLEMLSRGEIQYDERRVARIVGNVDWTRISFGEEGKKREQAPLIPMPVEKP